MTKAIVITMGGTGAKLGEALTHLVAAGIGPADVHLFPIDQDSGNGNTARLERVAKAYENCRKLWRTPGQPHVVTDDLFVHNLTLASPWTPHDGASTLSKLLGPLDEEDKALFDLLYCPQTEQDMGLGGGYRARPNVGATALTTAIRSKPQPDFWTELTQAMAPALNGNPVRVLLMGSLFGGTGAAGFPTLARLIRNHAANMRMGENLSIGGVLMLPYFDFRDPDQDAEGDAKNVARQEELLLQTRSALEHYAELTSPHGALFSDLYLVGSQPYTRLAYHAPQGDAQINPALAVELVAAIGGCRFLEDGPSAGGPKVFATAMQQANGWNWSDLPEVQVYERLGRLLRLATAWRHWEPLALNPKKRLGFLRDAWAKAQNLGTLSDNTGPHVEALDSYLVQLVEWAAMVEAYARGSGQSFNLWRTDKQLAAPINTNEPPAAIQLKDLTDEKAYEAAFNDLIVPAGGKDDPGNAANLFTEIGRRGNEDAPGLGMLMTALHRGCAVKGSI
jgi:hypothetical protein